MCTTVVSRCFRRFVYASLLQPLPKDSNPERQQWYMLKAGLLIQCCVIMSLTCAVGAKVRLFENPYCCKN